MGETIRLGELCIAVTRKDVKNVHLTVHPPDGRVTLVMPSNTRLDVPRAYAATRLPWIRARQEELQGQARETPRTLVTRESHYLWGKRYLLVVVERDEKPSVHTDHKRITLTVRPGSTLAKRAAVLYEWHRAQLHVAVPPLFTKWEARLDVKVAAYFLQRMKTEWRSCNHRVGNIRPNT